MMVFLTAVMNTLKEQFVKIPKHRLELISPSRLARRNQMKRHNHKYDGRNRNVFIIGVRRMLKAWQHSTNNFAKKAATLDRLNETRITAACLEHGMDKRYFLTSLAESDINLNRETLANLSIYEPRTFQTLVEFVKERSSETGLQSTKLGSIYGTVSRGIVDEVKKASTS